MEALFTIKDDKIPLQKTMAMVNEGNETALSYI
jgi:hypothetical protein